MQLCRHMGAFHPWRSVSLSIRLKAFIVSFSSTQVPLSSCFYLRLFSADTKPVHSTFLPLSFFFNHLGRRAIPTERYILVQQRARIFVPVQKRRSSIFGSRCGHNLAFCVDIYITYKDIYLWLSFCLYVCIYVYIIV